MRIRTLLLPALALGCALASLPAGGRRAGDEDHRLMALALAAISAKPALPPGPRPGCTVRRQLVQAYVPAALC